MRLALPEDAATIGFLRASVWNSTYRGIYPDELLDQYPFELYLEKDTLLLRSPLQHWYLFSDGERPVGYFSFGPYNYGSYQDFTLCINHLYILEDYHGMGLGKRAFSVIKEYCHQQHIQKFFCGCNANNLPAISFYRHMGGIQGDQADPTLPKKDQIIHFEFYLGD